MKVLVWQGYGCTDVYCVDTKEQREKALDELIKVAESQYLECSKLQKPVTLSQMVSLITEECNGDVESFDKLEFVEVKNA